MAAGSSAVTSRSTPQSEQTIISPTSVPVSRVSWASHSMQDTVDIIVSPLFWSPKSPDFGLMFFQRRESLTPVIDLIFDAIHRPEGLREGPCCATPTFGTFYFARSRFAPANCSFTDCGLVPPIAFLFPTDLSGS